MCGIVGLCRGQYSDPLAILSGMAMAVTHRGPDAKGFYLRDGFALGHCRLSIIDLSIEANQPMTSHDNRFVIVFNGEVYNYLELRNELLQLGRAFKTNSDTEVVLQAFAEWGPHSVHRFNGMFAFAVLDTLEETMWIFRDRMGVKPLYYTNSNGLAFASELRALRPLISSELDPDSVAEYFRQGYVGGGRSVFLAAKKLPAGCYLRFCRGQLHVGQYWSLNSVRASAQLPIEEWQEGLHEHLVSAFKLRMRADVPVGVFLSGGVDSSLVAALLAERYSGLRTFTIGFKELEFDESIYAREVAKHLGTDHTEVILSVEEATPLLESFYEIYDEPFADHSGIPTTLVSRVAAQNGVKVVLSADGGDELFAGYSHFSQALHRWSLLQRFPLRVRKVIASLLETTYSSRVLCQFPTGNIEHKVSALAELLRSRSPLELFEAQLANQTKPEILKLLNVERCPPATLAYDAPDHLTEMSLFNFNSFLIDDVLVKVDRATMFNSIEGREPFLDYKLVEYAFDIPHSLKLNAGVSKYLLKKILESYLPPSLVHRQKRGFTIPLFDWFSNRLDVFFESRLQPEVLKQLPILNSKEVLNEYAKYEHFKLRNKRYNIEKMWRILSFILWWEKWYQKAT